MSITQLLNRPCVITSRGLGTTEDELGNEIPAESDEATVCRVEQRTTDEPTGEGEISKSDWIGWFLPGTVVNTAASVDVEGQGVFEVVGAPMDWERPSLQAHHVEVPLRRVAGADDPAGS